MIYGGLAAQSGLAPMVAIGQQMTDVEVKNVTDYIRNSWGNRAPPVTGDKAFGGARRHPDHAGRHRPCAEIEQDKLKAAFEKLGIQASLTGLKQQDFVPTLARLVQQVKAEPTGRHRRRHRQRPDHGLLQGPAATTRNTASRAGPR